MRIRPAHSLLLRRSACTVALCLASLGTVAVLSSQTANAQNFSDNFNSVANGQGDSNWTNQNGANFVVTNPTGAAGTFDATNPNNTPLRIATINNLTASSFVYNFDIGAVSDGGAVARFQDINNFALFVVRANTSEIYWQVMQGGTLGNVLSDTPLPIAVGTAAHVQINAVGSTLSATVSQGANSYTSTITAVPFASGQLGLYDYTGGATTSLKLDNVVVSASAPEPGSIALLALAGLPALGMIVRRRGQKRLTGSKVA